MTTRVFNVANHILKRDQDFGLLQLIKLCYLAYGWYLAYYNARLFEEKIEAWRYGPVIPELYYALKHFRGKPLPSNCLDNLAIQDSDSVLSEDAQEVIDAVVDFYGKYTGIALSALTHKKGSPWAKTYAGERKIWVTIPDKVIKKHFDRLRRENNSENN